VRLATAILAGYIARVKYEPGIFEDPDPEAEAAADARAEADIAAGRVYPQDEVVAWLRTWGKPGRLPFHKWRT
jgi:predicted transcriptional regulator